MALATLGFFVFDIKTLPYQSIQTDIEWRYPSHSVVGAPPKHQFLGRGGTSKVISGCLYPEVSGGQNAISYLIMMADSGQSFPLIYGDGSYQGAYVIEKWSDNSSVFFKYGEARKIEVTLSLRKVGDQPDGLFGALLDAGLNFIKGLF